MKESKKVFCGILRAAVTFALASGLALALVGCGDSQSDSGSGSDASQIQTQEVAKPKNPLDIYSWEELSDISNDIAACPDKASATALAIEKGLCNSDGTLDGKQAKTITLGNGRETAAQVMGFYHDEKTSGGKAGITFIFKDSIADRPMNAAATNKGGWASSEMRTYLEAQFTTLPEDLQAVVVAVNKKTNNTGETESTSSVTTTSDKLWLVSAVEVWGDDVDIDFASKVKPSIGRNAAKVNNAQGSRYQLFSNMESASDSKRYEFTHKGNESQGHWWGRSPVPYTDDCFHLVSGLLSSNHAKASTGFCVVPCFCI